MASAKRSVKSKAVKSKPKTKKKVDWSAAGHKAWLTRLRNQKKNGGKVRKKTSKAQAKKPQAKVVAKKPQKPKKPQKHGKVKHGKQVGFAKYRVSKTALVKALTEDKRKELAPTEVVSLTWDVIRGANGNVSGHDSSKAKHKQ